VIEVFHIPSFATICLQLLQTNPTNICMEKHEEVLLTQLVNLAIKQWQGTFVKQEQDFEMPGGIRH